MWLTWLGFGAQNRFIRCSQLTRKRSETTMPWRVHVDPEWRKKIETFAGRSRNTSKPHPRFRLRCVRFRKSETRENWKLFYAPKQNEKLFRLHKQFFSVIDWQKVESGFQAFQKNWNSLFLCCVRLLFRKKNRSCCPFSPYWVLIFFIFFSLLFSQARVKLADFATMKPEGWNIYEKNYVKGVLGWRGEILN